MSTQLAVLLLCLTVLLIFVVTETIYIARQRRRRRQADHRQRSISLGYTAQLNGNELVSPELDHAAFTENVREIIDASKSEPRPDTVVVSPEAMRRHAGMIAALNSGDTELHERLMRELFDEMGYE